MTNIQYKETDTETYYDRVHKEYLVNWNEDGSMHWGYFDDLDAACGYPEFRRASEHWNQYMLERSGITKESKVLDLCCGNGNSSLWIARHAQCEVVGIDISATHIENANTKAEDFPKLNVSFVKGSVTKMPFPDNFFTHVWCQAALFQVPTRALALQESFRVLNPDGTFIFDDMVKRVTNVSDTTRKHLYERILIGDLFTPEFYQEQLTNLGFKVIENQDISPHMRKCYQIQSDRHELTYPEVSLGYRKTKEAIEAGEIGWWFFLAKKAA
ncbi:MAG: methyltransferase domain-containing protein [Cyanobacteria bacterium P01_D01_bin.50]